MHLVFSPDAAADLEEIGDFIARDNPVRAVSFVQELRDHCMRFRRQPGLGTLRPDLAEGLRMVPHGRYLIFYRELEGVLRVERILHSARDIGSDDLVG